jgi:hypothetical protein
MGSLKKKKLKKGENKMFMVRLTPEQWDNVLEWIESEESSGMTANGRMYFTTLMKNFHNEFMKLSK